MFQILGAGTCMERISWLFALDWFRSGRWGRWRIFLFVISSFCLCIFPTKIDEILKRNGTHNLLYLTELLVFLLCLSTDLTLNIFQDPLNFCFQKKKKNLWSFQSPVEVMWFKELFWRQTSLDGNLDFICHHLCKSGIYVNLASWLIALISGSSDEQ